MKHLERRRHGRKPAEPLSHARDGFDSELSPHCYGGESGKPDFLVVYRGNAAESYENCEKRRRPGRQRRHRRSGKSGVSTGSLGRLKPGLRKLRKDGTSRDIDLTNGFDKIVEGICGMCDIYDGDLLRGQGWRCLRNRCRKQGQTYQQVFVKSRQHVFLHSGR